MFVRKRSDKNEIARYKVRLVAQGFSQRLGIDYDEMYSPVMDIITFRYLISPSVSKGLDMRLMDVITAYLYGMLENDIYMKVPEGFIGPHPRSDPFWQIRTESGMPCYHSITQNQIFAEAISI